MINLLSSTALTQLAAARRNVILRRYVFLFAFVLVLVLASFAMGFYLLMLEAGAAKANSERYSQERMQYTDTIIRANEYRDDLKVAKEILASEIQLSDLTIGITKSLPANVILNSLSLSTLTLQEPLVLDMSMRSYDDAVRAKDQLEESAIFENVNIVSTRITPSEDREGISVEYPVRTTMNMTLSKQEES